MQFFFKFVLIWFKTYFVTHTSSIHEQPTSKYLSTMSANDRVDHTDHCAVVDNEEVSSVRASTPLNLFNWSCILFQSSTCTDHEIVEVIKHTDQITMEALKPIDLAYQFSSSPSIVTRAVGYLYSPAFTELYNGPVGIGVGLLVPVLLLMFLPLFGRRRPGRA